MAQKPVKKAKSGQPNKKSGQPANGQPKKSKGGPPKNKKSAAKVTPMEKISPELGEEQQGQESKVQGGKTQLNIAKTKRTIMIVFIVLLIFIVIRGAFEIFSLNRQEKETKILLEEKREEKEKLEKKKEYMNSDTYIEQAARDLLKMVKPGEILYVMKDDGEKNNTGSSKKQDSVHDSEQGEGDEGDGQ